MERNKIGETFQMIKVTESVNGRIVILECSRIKLGKVVQMSLIKVVNLIGNWSKGATIFKRKNYNNLIEFVRFNYKNQQVSQFIKCTIKDVMKFSSSEILDQTKQNSQIIPTEIFVSNSGNRVSFWLTEQNFHEIFKILTKLRLTQLLGDFEWISSSQQVHANEIEYGSQNFLNLIEKFSLQSMMKLIDMKQYGPDEYNCVSQNLNAVFSLVNYNYRYFYPPKDATRFLKKTSGVVLVSKKKFQQKKSSKWAQTVLLQSILEVRPTIMFASILANPQGPLYFQKYVFSQKFYSSIEQIYFLKNIVDYFNKDNLRNDLKYFTFISRIFPDYLTIEQIQQKIQKLKQQGWIRNENDFDFKNSSLDNQIEEDSEQEQNKEQNTILTLYKESQSNVINECKKQLNQTIEKLSQKQDQRNHLDQNQSQSDKYLQQLNEDQLTIQILSLIDHFEILRIQICLSCGFSFSKISYEQKQLSEFLTMFNQGNDKFCYTCSDIPIKYKLIQQQKRLKPPEESSVQENVLIFVPREQQREQLMKEKLKRQTISEQSIMKKQENKEFINLEFNAEKPKQNTEKENLICKSQKLPNQIKGESRQTLPTEIIQNTNPQQTSFKQVLIKHQTVEALNENMNKQLERMKEQNLKKTSQIKIKEIPREKLMCEQYFFNRDIMNLVLRDLIEVQTLKFMHDSLQLSKLAGLLTTQEYINQYLLVIYPYYFESMISYSFKKIGVNFKHFYHIPNIKRNICVLKQKKYMKVQNNVFQSIFNKTLRVGNNQTKVFSIENQQQQLTNNLYAFLQIKLEAYKFQISQHYRTYKNVMNQQYRVTQIQLKEMIAKFQVDLKKSIIKTTQQFLLTSRWMMLFLSEYIQFKSIQLRKNKILPEDENDIVYFINQIQFLLNLIATFVNVFNQPGQIKIIQQIQTEILNIVFLFLQNQKLIQQHNNLPFQMDLQVIAILITDMIDHFVAKKGSQATEDAKKLSNKHYTRFKTILQPKLKTLTVKRILNFHQQIKSHQMKIASQSLMSIANKDILTVKNLYVKGEINSQLGYFSSLLYLERHFQRYQSNFHNNQQIKAHIALLGLIMEECLQDDRLVLRSKSEPQHKIGFGIMYKIILQTIKKPEQATELISVLRSGNRILIDLTNFFIVAYIELAKQQKELQRLTESIKLYIQRVRYHHIKYTAKSMKHYDEVMEILQFLFKHRNTFFNIQRKIGLEIQLHMIIQIVILNSLPLYNIQLAYKSELKEIMKQLRQFDTKDNYSEVQDYYLKVVSYRHDKAKGKRKREIESKRKSEQNH